MKLLIKLCRSGSYTKEDGEELLDRSTRMRLAFLGNAIEMEDCVSECIATLADDLTPSNILTVLDDVPEELRGHEAMKALTVRVIDFLADLIDKWTESDPPTASEKDTKKKIVNALAKALGPVNQFFGQGITRKFYSCFYTCLPLKPHVLTLSPDVMEALLASATLQVATENEVYTLLGSWLYQSSYAGAYDGIHPVTTAQCLPLFCRLIKYVRFFNLSANYVAAVVTASPLAAELGLLPYMLSLSLSNRKAEEQGINPAPVKRGRGISAEYMFTSTFALADVLTLAPEESLYKFVGLIDGYPMRLHLKRHVKEEQTHFGILVYVLVPDWKTKKWEGGPRHSIHLEFMLRAGDVRWGRVEHYFDEDRSWGFPDFFGKRWEEIVYEGSEYFPDGRIKIELGVGMLEKEK